MAPEPHPVEDIARLMHDDEAGFTDYCFQVRYGHVVLREGKVIAGPGDEVLIQTERHLGPTWVTVHTGTMPPVTSPEKNLKESV